MRSPARAVVHRLRRPGDQPAEVVNAIALALLEEPALLAEPLPPLDELLHDALEDQHHFH